MVPEIRLASSRTLRPVLSCPGTNKARSGSRVRERSPQPFEPARGFGPLSATVEPKIKRKKSPIHQITLEGPSGSKPLRERARHATSHARIRQRPSSSAASAKVTLYPGSPGRPSSGGHHPGLASIGDPTYCSTRGRRTLAAVSQDRPHYLHPPYDELGARWRLHGPSDIEPWA